MKTSKLIFPGIFIALLIFVACQRDGAELTPPAPVSETNSVTPVPTHNIRPAVNQGLSTEEEDDCNPNAYIITLESRTLVNGLWEWVWSVKNSNPGNGLNGTFQNLSHWGMVFGSCVAWTSVAGAAYSANGTAWTSFTPAYHIDPSQGCYTAPVLKFDYGTTGSAKSYYRLTMNQEFPAGESFGYYKSGSRTKCCTFNFTGVGCGDDGGPR